MVFSAGDADHDTSKAQSFSSFVAACFTLNYIMGTGILTIPWAFHEAGVVLSCLSLTIVCLLGIMSSDYLLSAMARAEAVTEYMNDVRAHSSTHGLFAPAESMPLYIAGSESYGDAENGNGNGGSINSGVLFSMKTDSASLLTVRNSKFELTDLCRIFLGPVGEKSYTVSVMLFLYGVLWAYSTVFGKAMMLSLPISGLESSESYSVYVGVFSLIVLPLSLLELTEQVKVQVFLSSCRFLMVSVMVLTPLLVAYASPRQTIHQADGDEDASSYFTFGDQTAPEGAPVWKTSGISHMLPIVVFAILFHHGIPGMAKDVGDKSNMHNIFGTTLALCIGAYAVIGVVDSWYFGEHIEQSVNLNWSNFHYHYEGGCRGRSGDRCGGDSFGGWIASVVSFYTVIFPAIDVISAFPLQAHVLSSIFRYSLLANKVPAEKEKYLAWFCKFLSCVPPLVGALFSNDLGMITDFSGLVGLAIAFCFPALLYVFSERKMLKFGLTTNTRYKRFGSSPGVAIGIFSFGVANIVYTFLQYVKQDR